jgi:hypothetical protein
MGYLGASQCFPTDQAAAAAVCSAARWGGASDFAACTSFAFDAPGQVTLSITSFPLSGGASRVSTAQIPLLECELDIPDPANLAGFWTFGVGTVLVLYLAARHFGVILRLVRG